MKKIFRTNRFKKDIKKMKKRGKSFDIFKQVIQKLANDEQLEQRYRDHKLKGDYVGTRECHVEPDWLLIYEQNDDELILIRTGTHSDLFG
ncbi:MAG: type II toxin-antitoxin system mRNA interferase toxin, RelE/StbE family [Bacteroidetes bacterium]|jgi:mRNA interferase YafQ|nr:type II toxin-antitoxin system mRNA interferase toxin, RelE/StbE family [Bacteroidota bacterium]